VRRFTTSECEDFLRCIDAELGGPCEVVLIGGGAVALHYKGTHATTDLDLWSVSEGRRGRTVRRVGFWEAVTRARERSTAPVPVQKATIAEPPYSFEDRLIPLDIRGLTKLRVLVPEAHDLVLMKVARGEAHDLDAIEDIHRASTLELSTLLERYRETTSQVVGNLELHRLNFLAAVARLFGEEAAARVDAQTARRRLRD
jgi:hypothetical protein